MTTGWIRHQRWRQLHDEHILATGMPCSEPRYDLILGGAGWLRHQTSNGIVAPPALRRANHCATDAKLGITTQALAAIGLLACLRMRLSQPNGRFYAVVHVDAEAREQLKALEHAVALDGLVAGEAAIPVDRPREHADLLSSGKARDVFALDITRVPMETLQLASSPENEVVWLGSREASAWRQRKPLVEPASQRTVTRREVVANGMPYALVIIRWADSATRMRQPSSTA